jgi:hypothetical protein
VQHHLRHRVQAQADTEIGKLARGSQQVLRPPLPPDATWAITFQANAAAWGDSDEGSQRAIFESVPDRNGKGRSDPARVMRLWAAGGVHMRLAVPNTCPGSGCLEPES